MKLEYAITLNDFRALQKPFAGRAAANAGFKGVVIFSAAVTALGIYCFIKGLGWPVAAFLIGLAVVGCVAAYFSDVRSLRRAREKYDRDIALAYERLHCRDHRLVEVTDSGFSLVCKCGAVARPWSELTQFSENDRFFLLRTKAEGLLLPKSAFASEGDKTEFRRLATEQINHGRAFAARPVEFLCDRADLRSARLLHISRGGGWRPFLRAGAILFGLGVLLNFFLRSQGGAADPTIPLKAAALVLGAFLVATLVRVLQKGRQQRRPLRLYFGNEGLHLEDGTTIARYPWESFCGYLENDRIFLIYHNPRLYRVVPKRVLAERQTEFRRLLAARLQRFDYRNPVRLANAQVSKAA